MVIGNISWDEVYIGKAKIEGQALITVFKALDVKVRGIIRWMNALESWD
jgi:hypothetical protein